MRYFKFGITFLFLICLTITSSASSRAESDSRLGLSTSPERTLVDVTSPRIILQALSVAYPDKISLPEQIDGEWSILVNSRRFFWAGGRLLEQQDLADKEKYVSYYFKPNPREIPPFRVLGSDEIETLKENIRRRERGEAVRNQKFITTLWGMETQEEAKKTIVSTRFLGWRIPIHPGIVEPLSAVEEEIMEAMHKDNTLLYWINSLEDISTYVWRNIAGSGNRSMHSLGLAIDLLPDNYFGKQVYWRWTSIIRNDWWAVPPEGRFMPPKAIRDAFENNGFIWGGKWFLYDQVHFEYRPELMILSLWEENSPK